MSLNSNGRNRLYLTRQDDDLRTRLFKLYALFSTLLLVGLLIFALAAKNRLEQSAQAAHEALARAIALAITSPLNRDFVTEEIHAWLTVAEVEQTAVIFIINAAGETIWEYENDIQLPHNAAWQQWRRTTIRAAANREEGSWITADPSQRTWLHAYAATPDGGTVIIQQPTDIAFTTSRFLSQVLWVAAGVYLAGGLFAWLLLKRLVITPLEHIEASSQRIRWRGETSGEEQGQLQALGQRRDQIGNLARSLLVMEQDIKKRFVQLATLLETSRVVASSLNEGKVLDNILDEVQNLFDVESCAVVVLDKRADVFRIRASHGLSDEYVTQLRIAPTEPHSTAMRALRNQIPIQISDTETDLSFAAFRYRAQEEGFRSVLAIPLLTHHAPPAVLLLYKTEPYRYSYSELELASSFGHHVLVAMENAALFAQTDERLQAQTRQLEAIVESLNDGLILASLADEVLYCNQQARVWLQLSRRELQVKTASALVADLIENSQECEIAEAAWQAAVTGEGLRAFDVAQVVGNGRVRDLRIHLFDVTDAQGELLGRGQLWQDISRDKELDRMKSALISTVSHELRTPLAAIKGYVSTLLADDVAWDAVAQREFLQTISDETDRLAGLVKNLLDMSRLEAGTLALQRKHYGLDEVIGRAVRLSRPLLGKRLQVEMPSYLPTVWVDSSRIETVIRNLLENAAKYSPPEGMVELKVAEVVNGRVHIHIRDYGPGIPDHLHEKIFDRFYRIDGRLTRAVGGAGLGLAICQGFIEAHDGHITVLNAHPGATFTFSLPIAEQVPMDMS